MRHFIHDYWEQLSLMLIAIALFSFWVFLYPYLLIAKEISQLFLWTSGYFMERIVIPGGLAQYLGEFLVQFFNNPVIGAGIETLIFFLAQQLASKYLQQVFPKIKRTVRFGLSLTLPILLLVLAMIPSVSMTPTIAILLVILVLILLPSAKNARIVSTCVFTPLMYWLVGPAAVLLLAGCIRWIPLTGTIFAFSLIGSSYFVSYPLRQIILGLDYYWDDIKQIGTYEEMECDMLIRMKKWNTILQKYQAPVSPAVRCAVYFAMYQTRQISQEELFQSLVIPRENQASNPSIFNKSGAFLVVNRGSLVSAFMVNDIAFQLGMPNVSQRGSFDAMEYIPNYNKSGRALRRLTEVCIVTSQYQLARKYISILENTFLYREFAHEMRDLVNHPEKIKDHSFYQLLKENYVTTDDMFFI